MTIKALLKPAAITGLVAGSLLGAAALAQTPSFTFSVPESALDARGEIVRVHERLSNEAAAYCDSLIETGSERETARELCRVDVVDTVVARIDHPALPAYHAEVRARETGDAYAVSYTQGA